MDTLIGFLELFGWIAAVLVLASGITYAVVRLFPSRDEKPASADASSTPPGT